MRGAAIVVTAVAIGRAFVAFVGFALVRTKLAPCVCFAGTCVMPAFHVFTSHWQWDKVQIHCHSTISSFWPVSLAISPTHHRRIAMTKLETLDNLVKVCIDSAERYRRAAADVGKEKLVQFFQQQEAARRRDADDLNLERKRLGGEIEKAGKESGSVGGFIDRTAMDLSVVMSKGDTGVVEWCREDAEKVSAEYEKALRDADGTTRALLERQLAENRATLASLDKVLKPYGHPRS
jgi:uncharacterized protein (TIGR02284 family)